MTMGGDAEERLRRALGDQALRALSFHVSKILGVDMFTVLERDPEAVRTALRRLLRSERAAEIVFSIMFPDRAHPPTREAGGRGWEA
jgi:hypothetical protein